MAKTTTKTTTKTAKTPKKDLVQEDMNELESSNTQKHLLTKEGMRKLQDELTTLKTEKKQEIAAKLKEAISYGDLSENSEYDEAKNEQAFVEARIRELEDIIANAKVITVAHAGSTVEMGCTISVENLTTKSKEEYLIVGSTEADPMNNKISNESPVGAALLGQKVGTEVEVKAPRGIIKYKILKIK